jgi:hypothetical protein
MNNKQEKFDHKNMSFPSMKERLNFYESKIKLRTVRPFILADIQLLQRNDQLNFDDVHNCLKILTSALLLEDGQFYDSKVTDRIVSLLPGLVFLNKDDPAHRKRRGYHGDYIHPENLNDYFSSVESIITKVEIEVPKNVQKDKFAILAENMRDISGAMASWKFPMVYNGDNLKISNTIGTHLNSAIILPVDPKEAVSALFGDNIRAVFAEYDEKESAETYIQNYYGTDGLYADHYRAFLNCKKRYPEQKTTLA